MRKQSETPAMTVRQVAAYLNVNEKTVYRLAQRRELPAFKVAGAWRFKREDIDLWIERQKASPEGHGQRGLATATKLETRERIARETKERGR